MPREASNVLRRCAVACAIALAAAGALRAQERAPADNAPFFATADNATAAAAAESDREKARRAVMRKVAVASLLSILLLLCFVVVVMIVTRRLRIRYLHYDRKITFSRLWDVWWHTPDGRGRDRKDPKT